MADSSSRHDTSIEAAEHNDLGLMHFAQWEMEQAVAAFQSAALTEPDNPEFHMNLARAHARAGSFDDAMRSLGDYLHAETDEVLAERYERLFSSTLDEVEERLIDGMQKLSLPLPLTGRAIRMWLEFRLTLGRQPMPSGEPNAWAAALAKAVCRVNFEKIAGDQLAEVYKVSSAEIRDHFDRLLDTLDLIPADYRYFIGEDNPLDRLVEAAQMLDDLNKDFRDI